MDTPDELIVNGIEVTPESGVVIHYGRFPRDVRKNGLIWNHSVHIPAGSDYDDELDTALEAIKDLLADALDDEDRVEPIEIPEEEEQEDE